MYVNSSGKLTIWHENSGAGEFHELSGSPVIGTCEWIRITIEQNYSGNRYQVRIKEDSPITDAKGWDAPVGGFQPGSWFNMVQKNGSMSRFSVDAADEPAYLDDLQVKLGDPVKTPFDLWVAQFGLPFTQDGPDDDPDGDGMTNLEEWIAGTDPSDPSDVFEIVQVEFLSGSNCVLWRFGTNTEITTPFALWRSTNLANLVFEEIANGIPGDPSRTNLYYDTSQPPVTPAHYRSGLPTNHP